MENDATGKEAFCNAYDVCVEWTDPSEEKKNDNNRIKCSELTKCEWEGMHANFIGDGICHDNMDGCYNTEGMRGGNTENAPSLLQCAHS